MRINSITKQKAVGSRRKAAISLTPGPSPTGRGVSEGRGEGKPEKKKLVLLSTVICFLFSVFCLPGLTYQTQAAPTYTLPEILQHMEETQKKVDSFRARFSQTKTIYLLEGAVKSEGELYFQRPGRLYWETKDPNRLVVVMNDNTLWLYYPDLKAADKLDITLLRGLINKYMGLGQSLEALKAQYDVKLAEVGPQVIILDLFPKTPRLRAQIKRLRLWVNTKNWFPQEVENVEANGDRTHIVFSSFDLNITIPAGRFTFTPPRGVKMKDLGSLEVPQ